MAACLVATGALSAWLVPVWLKGREGARAPASAAETAPAVSTPAGTPVLPHISQAPNPCRNLYSTVCLKRPPSRDPSGTVKRDVEGELQALRIYEEVIHENPDWPSDRVDAELVHRIYSPQRRERVEKALHWVESSLRRFIDEQPPTVFNAREKRLLKKRLSQVELQLPPAIMYDDEPDLYTKNDIFYERLKDGKMRLRFGGAYLLSAKSWFNIVFTLAHELGHALDPCELRAAAVAIPAYDRLSACFFHQKIIASRKTRNECGENDQLSEAFADWIGVQITSQALAGLATEFDHSQVLSATVNSVRDLCEEDEGTAESDQEFHPSPKTRIERIFGLNPLIRKTLGCELRTPAAQPEDEYCDFNWRPRK